MKKITIPGISRHGPVAECQCTRRGVPQSFIDKSLTEAEGYTEWIPEPPKFTGGEFANDFYYYQWGRAMRENEQEAISAIWDESVPLIMV